MALTYGFYNSIEGDRVYDAIQFGRIFDGIIKDGVYATYEKGMMVIASENPNEVIIQPGRAWFNHTWSYNDANVIFEAPAPEVLLERIDALVLEINEELSSRENSYKWVTGTPSSRPENPTLTNTSTIHQYPLCYVHRYPETTMIYTRDITNAIGTSECPFATGVLEGIDLDAWINQWDDEFHTWENSKKTQFEAWMLSQETAFTTWYNAFKNQMASDVQEVEDFVDYLESVLDASTAIHLQEEIDDLRDEISSGSYITVTTINPELYGRNVTITESGGTVFTEKFDNTGIAEFKSVPYVGNLTISSTYGTQTAERVVNTPYYARYEFAIAFWAATVNIVGDPEMAGYSVTVKDSNEAIVGTVVLDNLGTGVYTAIKPDTYKFILTYGGQTMEVTLSVTQETTYTVDLHADRFKWENWVDASETLHSTDYDSLDEVLADEKAVRELMTIHACIDYLANIDDEDEDVKTIIENDLAAKWINLRDYALDTLYANTVIKDYMDNSLVELKGQVPTMTSNTAPYGEASASSIVSDLYQSYHAFNKSVQPCAQADAIDCWHSSTTTDSWLAYRPTTPVIVEKFSMSPAYYTAQYGTCRVKNYKYQGYDGTSWVDLTETLQHPNDGSVVTDRVTKNKGQYSSYRIFIFDTWGTAQPAVYSLQFYAYEYSSKYFLGEWCLMPQVPKMTSNTAPYGEAFADSYNAAGHDAYTAFDQNASTNWNSNKKLSEVSSNVYIGYHSTSPICVKRFSMVVEPDATAVIKLQGSNDGTNYVNIGDTFNVQAISTMQTFEVPNNTISYSYHRVLYVSQSASNMTIVAGRCYTLQFYAYEPKGNVPVMTANDAPYGVASASAAASGYAAYRAFDGLYDTEWTSGSTSGQPYIQYKFVNPICVKRFKIRFRSFASSTTLKISASNDGTNFTDLTSSIVIDGNDYNERNINNTDYYLYYRLTILSQTRPSSSSSVGQVDMLQFYGRELKPLIAPLLSTTSSKGVASADSFESDTYKILNAFDGNESTRWNPGHGSAATQAWLMYEFNSSIELGFIRILATNLNGNRITHQGTLEVYRDGDWETVSDSINFGTNTNNFFFEANYSDVTKMRVKGTRKVDGSYGYWWEAINTFEAYGKDYSEKEFEEGTTKKWLYDHGVELDDLTLNDITQSNYTNVAAIKEPSDIKCYAGSGNYISSVSKTDAIDLTDYSRVGIIIDPLTVLSNIISAASTVKNENTSPTAGIQITEVKNACYLDVQSINQSLYIFNRAKGQTSSGAMAQGYLLKEWWLE